MDDFWLTRGTLLTPRGMTGGAVRIARGRIAALRSSAPRGASAISVRGAYIAPGFIDLHVWGDPRVISREAAKGGTTAFLTTLGPASRERLAIEADARSDAKARSGAACVGLHLEGPFLNPRRAGALPKRWMRRPAADELGRLQRAARGRLRLVTMAPELPGAIDAIRWCRRHRIAVSLGHSEAAAVEALRAVDAGASAVTHVFNGMRPLHHRRPVLLDVALNDQRLATMVIFDGVHVSPHAFRLLVRAKGVERVVLVTDSIRYQGWSVTKRRGAYYTTRGTLAGSSLTMIEAVRNAVRWGGVSLEEAVRMASEVPARLIGAGSRGRLAVGACADLVVFGKDFRVVLTVVAGQVVYQRGS